MNMEEAKQKVNEKAFYKYRDKRHREPRKDCQGKSCPIYNCRGGTMYCGSFFGGWCDHFEYGTQHDKELIEVSDVLAILEELNIIT